MSAEQTTDRCCESGSACCDEFRNGWLQPDSAEALAATFAALSDPVRLRMLSFLSHAPGPETSAGDLVACVCRSQPTVSHHLQVLHAARLVTRERHGAHVRYALNRGHLEHVLDAAAIAGRR